jgi:hypothetical protein
MSNMQDSNVVQDSIKEKSSGDSECCLLMFEDAYNAKPDNTSTKSAADNSGKVNKDKIIEDRRPIDLTPLINVTDVLDQRANETKGLSGIEKGALKDLQKAIVDKDASKIADIVSGFKENPDGLKKIAEALQKNLGGAVKVSYDIEKTGDSQIPTAGHLKFAVQDKSSKSEVSFRTNDSEKPSALAKTITQALGEKVIDGVTASETKRINSLLPIHELPADPPVKLPVLPPNWRKFEKEE